VHLVDIIAGHLQVKKIGCSGGVFQNSLLVDMMQLSLGEKYPLYLHQHLSPNDENISFGQLVYYDNDLN
jgi:hydrogenase maturation protein HypF